MTALSKAGVASRSTVHSVELVGGLSRMPALQAAVADAVGRPVARTLIAEESVARGAALAAAQLSSFMKVRQHACSPKPMDGKKFNLTTATSDGSPRPSLSTFDLQNRRLDAGVVHLKTSNLTRTFSLRAFQPSAT